MKIIVSILRSKVFMWIVIVLPGLYPLYPLLTQDPSVTADAPKYLLEHMGKTATLLLIGVLSLSPLRALLPKSKIVNALNRHRRLLGVSAFVYVVFHLGFYFVYEQGFASLPENLRKPFILSGAAAFVILMMLAVTSTNWAIRKMGAKRWKQLHRLVYVAALLVVYHQAAQEKTGAVQTIYFFAPLAVLQLLRIAKMVLPQRVAAS